MKFASLALAVVIGATVISSGCSKERFPVVSKMSVPAEAATVPAPMDAHYLLFASNKTDPVARAYLNAGELIGFQENARDTMGKAIDVKGAVSAVAGDFVVKLKEDVSYEWRQIPNSSTEERLKNENFLFPQP